MHHSHATKNAPQTKGKVLHAARLYDRSAMWQILTLGRGNKIWEEMLDLAGLQAGDSVLDVGCGPGSLTLRAKGRVGQTGKAAGIDASPEMIEYAQEKARRKGLPIDFRLEVVEKLPFPDSSFDVVLSSLMMHHLPEDVKRQGLAENRRVLKPGGRLVILDFKRQDANRRQFFLHAMPHPTVPVGVQDLGRYLEGAGFEQVELSDTRMKMLGYLRGVNPK
jgi:demethylmenaquinone methyltransferase/2-methoxy-6-polyprenyl-1,4-benzoquinol methylase/phosphoethanolamine N-methyltransferase